MADRFPVLWGSDWRQLHALGCPQWVPWALVAPHEQQALFNHYQTLQRLAERGGLDPAELVAVLEDRRWKPMPLEAAVEQVKAFVSAFEGANG